MPRHCEILANLEVIFHWPVTCSTSHVSHCVGILSALQTLMLIFLLQACLADARWCSDNSSRVLSPAHSLQT